MQKKPEHSNHKVSEENNDLNEMLECETYFGKDFFWNELEMIVVDGVIGSNDD
ncbi:hypothetical protein [Litchfieldia salsa]|uniref:Uncharacterized protein n=1 Tax=Litchfieldia salsa TaxID=930152 RepID=A0A1H0TF95_9BACI|nr:hypothetical protein [Litchfieldia salsa]SDP52732.1 hypothetical protein SAMN05216565_103488 [Litchfieldia salsa]